MEPKLLRILDANFNRAREGLRVCEDICRFLAGAAESASELRRIRHGVTGVLKSFRASSLLEARDSAGDPGRVTHEKKREDWTDLYMANMQRSKESLRVLEEVAKLDAPQKAARLKRLRFKLYEREKKDFSRIQALRHHRAR